MIKEVYREVVKETSINIVQSAYESLRKKNITKTGIRIYKDGKIGVSGALGDYDEKALEEMALNNLTVPYSYEASKEIKHIEDYEKEILSDKQLSEEVEELLEVVRREYDDFGIYNKINLVNQEVSLNNSCGLELLSKDSYISFDLMFSDKSIAGLEGFFWEFTKRSYNRAEILEEIDVLCRAYRNILPIPDKDSMPVVFYEYDMQPLMKFATDLNGVRFGSGTSIFSKDLDKRIFSEGFSLYATKKPEDTMGAFFDAEGVINKDYRYALIEEGIIRAPYTDKRTADKYKLPLTGAAGCQYDSAPTLAMPKLKIKESNKTIRELLAGEQAIFVLTASGGDFTPEGAFATPVQVPLLFDGENFIGRLPALQISSRIQDMFGGAYRGVSKDFINAGNTSRALIMDMKVAKL